MDSFLPNRIWLGFCAVLLALVVISAAGCARLRETRQESPYAAAPPAPLFDGTNATAVDPASLPPIIRGNAPIVPVETKIITEPTIISSPPPQSQSQSQSPQQSLEIEQLTKRVRELESDVARQASELRLWEQSTIPPEVLHTVSKPVVASETPMLLPVIQIAGVDVQQQRGTIRITIPDAVLFQNGTYQLLPTGEETLKQVMSEVKVSYPNATIEIEGHSDNVVTNPQNPTQLQEITCFKASLLMKVLVSQLGIDAKLVRPTGFGGTLPIADNTTEDGREQNRRFVFVLNPAR